MTTDAGRQDGRLAIVAGSGLLPHFVAEAAREAGENPFILRLRNESDQTWSGFDNAVIGVGDMAGLSALLKANAIDRVVFVGRTSSGVRALAKSVSIFAR